VLSFDKYISKLGTLQREIMLFIGNPKGRSTMITSYFATNCKLELYQRRRLVVCSNKLAQKRLTESNGTPAMDLGQMNVVLK
jgi:hypothetical protein